MNKIIILLSSVFVFLLLSCKDKVIDPIEEDNSTPGSRDYEWTLDTIYSPNNTLYSIWGAAPNDLWLGGRGGITSYDRLWHFDGIKWKPYEKQYIGTFPNCIFGFNSNDIWIGGNDGNLFHYDGSSWNKTFELNDNSNIWDIYGNNSSEVYALGTRFLLKYSGNQWKEEVRFPNSENIYMQEILGDKSGIYIWGKKPAPQMSMEPDTLCYWIVQNKSVKQIFSKTMEEITFTTMSRLGERIYFLIAQDLYRYENGSFVKRISFNLTDFKYGCEGRNEKDIFLRMNDGLAHYNGVNVEYLYKFTNSNRISLYSPQIFEKEVFYPGEDYLNGYKFVLHGKLKE